MKPGLKILIITLAILIIAGGLIYLFNEFVELVEVEQTSGFKGEARLNQFLAAQKLLEKMERRYQVPFGNSINNEVPEEYDTAFFLVDRETYDKSYLQKLLAWAGNGGHLIINCEFNLYNGRDDYFTEQFKLTIPQPDNSPDNTLFESTDFLQKVTDNQNIAVPLGNTTLYVSLNQHYLLDKEPAETNWEIAFGDHYFLLQYAYGEGLVTFLNGTQFMENRLLNKFDNAKFFWYLVNYYNAFGDIWFYTHRNYESFFSVLFSLGWKTGLGLLVLLILIIWRYSRRFETILPEPPPLRRSLLEHITAAGRFVWYKKMAWIIIASLQKALKRKLTFKYPTLMLNIASDPIHRKKLCELIEVGNLNFLLEPYNGLNLSPKEFTRLIQTYKRIK